MKIKNKILVLTSLTLPSLVMISCNSNNEEKKPQENQSNLSKKIENIDEVKIDITKWFMKSDFGSMEIDKKDLYFSKIDKDKTEFTTNSDKWEITLIGLKEERDNENNPISDSTGKGELTFQFKDKKTNEITLKQYYFEGFKKAIYGDADGKITLKTYAPTTKEEKKLYRESNQSYRFDYDNKNYMEVLKKQWGFKNENGEFNINKVRPEIVRNLTAEENFNNNLNNLTDTYENQLLKGFTVPVYNQNGDFQGLKMDINGNVGKGDSWLDYRGDSNDRFKINGLARYLINQNYKDIALQTYSISFNNHEPDDKNTYRSESGTMWILDYQKRNDGSYPTKWYFGTNVHVADALMERTSSVQIRRLRADAPLINKFGLTGINQDLVNFKVENFKVNNNIRSVYKAIDFLEKDPKDFLEPEQKSTYSKNKEFADFAVIELDFENIIIDNKSGSELAKDFTNNYANNFEKQIKFLKTSYLQNYDKINFPITGKEELKKYLKTNDSLFLLGYPQGSEDWFFDKYENTKENEEKKHNFSLWTNASFKLYDNLNLETQKEWDNRGNFLSYELGYRFFKDKPGISDQFLVVPKNGKDFYINKYDPSFQLIIEEEIDENGNKKKKIVGSTYDKNKTLIGMGLNYMPREYVPFGGSSGSSMRNQKNELVGVFHTANSSAKTGLVAAFRSEGYDYNGLYGSYNLPQYDLIYGGGKDQKQGKSFREALQNLYGDNVKTALFKNINQIPEDFKFKK